MGIARKYGKNFSVVFFRHPEKRERSSGKRNIRFGVLVRSFGRSDRVRRADTFPVRTKSEDFEKNVEVKSESWGALADLDPNVTSHHLSGNGVIVDVRGSFQIEAALLISYR